jgi:hypothetical protein
MQGNLIPYWDTTDLGKAALQLANPGFTAFLRTNANGTISALNAADFRTAIDAQPLDSDLTAIAALTTTAYGRGLLTLADSSGMTLLTSTWTPAYVLGSGSVTTNVASGRWVRIGKLTFIWGVLRSASISSPSGDVRISVPFAGLNEPNGAVSIGHFASWAGGLKDVTGVVFGANIILYKDGSLNTVTASDLSASANGNFIRFSAVYEMP